MAELTEDPERANPKDAAGRAKLPVGLWPSSATYYGAVGLMEGMLKYGRSNWRETPVYASIYIDAVLRHVLDYAEGNDFTEEGGPELGNALACLAILVDAGVNGTLIDDRNYQGPNADRAAMKKRLDESMAKLRAKFGERKPKHWDARDMKSRDEEDKIKRAPRGLIMDANGPHAGMVVGATEEELALADAGWTARRIEALRYARRVLSELSKGQTIETTQEEYGLMARHGWDITDILMFRNMGKHIWTVLKRPSV